MSNRKHLYQKTNMKNISHILLAALLAPLSALAQAASPETTSSGSAIKLESPREESVNQFGASFRMMFNVSVDFKNLGGFTAQGHTVPGQDVQQTSPGNNDGSNTNRTYDDGYNWVDSTGNNHVPGFPDTTWFWEYDNNDPSQRPGNGTIVMHSSTSAATAESNGREDEPELGFEISYRRQILRNDSWNWGVEVAFGHQSIYVGDAQAVSGIASQIIDTFTIPTGVGDPPKQPGVDGSFSTAGPLLGSLPSRTNGFGSTTINGSRNFEADIFGFRVGPYLEIALCKKMAVSLSGGLSLAYVASDFSFSPETVMFQGVSHVNPGGSGSHEDWVVGGYVAANLLYKINQSWGLFCGVQLQAAGTYSHTVGGKRADLDLGQAVYLSIGAAYSF